VSAEPQSAQEAQRPPPAREQRRDAEKKVTEPLALSPSAPLQCYHLGISRVRELLQPVEHKGAAGCAPTSLSLRAPAFSPRAGALRPCSPCAFAFSPFGRSVRPVHWVAGRARAASLRLCVKWAGGRLPWVRTNRWSSEVRAEVNIVNFVTRENHPEAPPSASG